MDDLHKETAEALTQALDGALDEKTMGRLKKQASDIFQGALDDIEWNLKENLVHNLAAYTAEMAKRTVEALLEGNEELMRQYLGCREYSYTGRSTGAHPKHDIANQHSVINGKLFHYGGIDLRRKLVEAHRDLIASERILDLEDQVASLVAQVNKKDAENEKLIRRLNEALA